MFVIGFIFWGPAGLSNIAVRGVEDTPAAAVSSVLSANLPGTGTYMIPNDRKSPAQTAMYGNGPVATVKYQQRRLRRRPTVFGVGLLFNFVYRAGHRAGDGGDRRRRVSDFGSGRGWRS